MPARLCKQEIIGNIGMVPEYKHKEGQTPFAVCTVGVDRPGKHGQEKEKRDPLWYRVMLFGHHATSAVKYGYKGQQVYVSGRFDVSDWTDRDGKARYTLELVADDFQMLGESPSALAERVDSAIAADRGARTGGDKGGSKLGAKGAAGDLAKDY
jgi:single-strand DNA-binding protein